MNKFKKAKKLWQIPGSTTKLPMFEAPYDYTIEVYRSDCRKAVIGDPMKCLIAMGAMRDKRVLAAWLGSGKEAYVAFKGTKLRAAHVLHFTMNAKASRVRDYFDTHKEVKTQVIKLSAPTPGRTHAHRSKLNKDRAARIKAGTHIVKPRGKINQPRMTRLGVPHRPHPKIVNNVVSIDTARETA